MEEIAEEKDTKFETFYYKVIMVSPWMSFSNFFSDLIKE